METKMETSLRQRIIEAMDKNLINIITEEEINKLADESIRKLVDDVVDNFRGYNMRRDSILAPMVETAAKELVAEFVKCLKNDDRFKNHLHELFVANLVPAMNHNVAMLINKTELEYLERAKLETIEYLRNNNPFARNW